MEHSTGNEAAHLATHNGETSIFDEVIQLPVYYSDRAIRIFSIIFGVLFGAVLMAMNLKNTAAKKGIGMVLAFGFVYTLIEGAILNYIPNAPASLAIVFNWAGGYILSWFFWEKYIGKNVPYTKRSVLIPAIIGIVLVALIILAIFAGGGLAL